MHIQHFISNVLRKFNLRVALALLGFCKLSCLLLAFFFIGYQAFSQHQSHHKSEYEPLWYVPNKGQLPTDFLASVDVGGGMIYFEKNKLRYKWWDAETIKAIHNGQKPTTSNIKHHEYQITWVNANQDPTWILSDTTAFYYNYFLGNDPRFWAGKVHPGKTYSAKALYENIDLIYYSHMGLLKSDYVIKKGGKPSNIKLAYQHVDALHVNELGNLVIKNSVNTVVEQIPEAYQLINGKKVIVACKFKMLGNNQVGFELPNGYNKAHTLVIDPILIFSTHCGSTTDSWGFTSTYDLAGNGYAGGLAFGRGLPVTLGAYQTTFAGVQDVEVIKFNPLGTDRVYCTYLGGADTDQPMSMVVNSVNQLVVLSKSRSANYPTTNNAYDRTFNGGFDIVLTVFGANGDNLVGSTFFGGTADDGNNNGIDPSIGRTHYNYADSTRSEVVLDAQDRIYIASCTRSSDIVFPPGSFQPNLAGKQDGLLARFSPNLSTLEWGTYIGGMQDDAAFGLALTPNNRIYATGGTASSNFPMPTSGYNTTHNGNTDAFLICFNPQVNQLLHGTFYGTSLYNQAYMVQREADNGKMWILGQTEDSIAVTPNTYTVHNGRQFIAGFDSTLNLLQTAMHFGNGQLDNSDLPELAPTAFLVDKCSRIYFAGWAGETNWVFNRQLGRSLGFDVTTDAFQSSSNGSSFYLMALERNATELIYGSYFGGNQSQEHVDGGTSRFDPQGVVYQVVCAGCGGRSDFPTTSNAFSRTNNSSNCNLALFKLDFQIQQAVAGFQASLSGDTICENAIATFRNTSKRASNFLWDFGDGSPPSNLRNPIHTYQAPGTYFVRLIVSDTIAACSSSDTILKPIRVAPRPKLTILNPGEPCLGDTVVLKAAGAKNYFWSGTGTIISAAADSAIVYINRLNVTYTAIGVTEFGCRDTAQILIIGAVVSPVILTPDTTICLGDSIQISTTLNSQRHQNWKWLNPVSLSDSLAANPWVNPEKQVTYVVRYATQSGCESYDSIRITVEPRVFITTTPDQLVCKGTRLRLQANGAIRYRWDIGAVSSAIDVVALSDTAFIVTGFTNQCKSNPDTVLVKIDTVRAGFSYFPDTVYAPGSYFFKNNSSPKSVPTWIFNAKDTIFGGDTISRYYAKPGYYRVGLRVQSGRAGCIDTVSRLLFVDSVEMVLPNAFTPNGNGINDTFYGRFYNFEWVDFSVFDRWGNELYRSFDIEARWDGTYKGEPLMPGVYPYLLEGLGKNGKMYRQRGVVHLIR